MCKRTDKYAARGLKKTKNKQLVGKKGEKRKKYISINQTNLNTN